MARPGKRGETQTPRAAMQRAERDDLIERNYQGNPSLRALLEGGQIDREAFDHAMRLRQAGPPVRPSRTLVSALRAERERQGLTLADIARRSGMDRAAIHKLEVGVSRNPTLATLNRYADALGVRLEWTLRAVDRGESERT